MKTKKEIREKIIEIATKMDAAKTINEVASWHILNDKKALLDIWNKRRMRNEYT
jgi:hypothetical protein